MTPEPLDDLNPPDTDPTWCGICGTNLNADWVCPACDAKPDLDTTTTECPVCGGHGGGPDAALRCHECRGSGRVRAGDDGRDYDLDDGAPFDGDL